MTYWLICDSRTIDWLMYWLKICNFLKISESGPPHAKIYGFELICGEFTTQGKHNIIIVLAGENSNSNLIHYYFLGGLVDL